MKRRFYVWLGLTVALLALLWTAFAKLIVPPIIVSAYRGESFSPLLNNFFMGLDKPLEKITARWDLYTQDGLIACVGFGLIALIATHPAFFRKYVKDATPESLGAIRILTCAILLASTICSHLSTSALLPEELRDSMGIMQLFYALPIGFERLVESQSALQLLWGLTALLLFLGMMGWQTRFVLPLGAFCFLVEGGILRQYAHFWHQELLPLYVLAVLSFTPCGDGLSVDRLWKIAKGQAVPIADHPAPIYSWSRYACWLVMALIYVGCGLNKLRFGGLLWWNATNMRTIVYKDTLQPTSFDWGLSWHLIHAPDFLFALLGLSAILLELAYGMVLFSETARRILPISIMMLHIGIFFLQNVAFFDLILLPLVFYDFTDLRKASGRWLTLKLGTIQVLYDGFCPFCRRTVRILDSFDLFERLDFIDFHTLDLTQFNSRHGLNLKLSDLEEDMYVVSQGRAYPGFYGYRVIALALPAFWLLAPWLFLPGISSLGTQVYRYVARNRLKIINCDSQCAIASGGALGASAPASERWATVASPTPKPSQDFRYPILISGLSVFLVLVWVFRVEFYPLSTWQMYSRSHNSGAIAYRRVLVHRQSGSVSHANFADFIGITKAGRYGKAITTCFDPARVYICKKFLSVSASTYNQKAPPGEKVTQFEIQRWVWNFRSDPSAAEPKAGKLPGSLVERFIFKINDTGDSKPNNSHPE